MKKSITAYIYHNDKSYVNLVSCIFILIHKIMIYKVWKSPFYGIMVDELLNISIIGHLVVFVTIIKGGLHVIVFLGLSKIEVKINIF